MKLELFDKKNKITIQLTVERENSFIKEKGNEPIFSLKYNNKNEIIEEKNLGSSKFAHFTGEGEIIVNVTTKPIIDFHVHPAYYESYNPSALDWISLQIGTDQKEFVEKFSDPKAMVDYFHQSGVDYAVCMAELSPITTGMCTNEYVAEFTKGQEMFFPFANINPYLRNKPAAELEFWVKECGFKGVKLYPTYQYFYPNDQMMYPLYAKAEELGVPVMLHTGSSVFKGARLKFGDPIYLDDVAVDFPNLNILLVHSGRGFWYDRAFFLARLHENVYMEIAGLPPKRLLDYFPELERNADKIVFGSDWPGLVSVAQNIQAIRDLPISDEAKDKILGLNAAKILNIGISD